MGMKAGVILMAVVALSFSAVVMPTSEAAASSAARPVSAPINLDLRGSFSEGGKLEGGITGVPAPGPSGLPDGLLVVVKMNGVTVETPSLGWSYVDGEWRFGYPIPSGSASSIISVVIVSSDGTTLSRSFTVGP